jgi:hypothetical protein
MRIDANYVLDSPPNVLKKRLEDTSRAINGGIEFGNPSLGIKNIQGYWLATTSPGVADTEFTVTHNLGYIPTGIIIFSLDKAAIVYSSRKNLWTGKQIFLKVNQPTVNLQGLVA